MGSDAFIVEAPLLHGNTPLEALLAATPLSAVPAAGEPFKVRRVGKYEITLDGVNLIVKGDDGEEVRNRLFPYIEVVAEGRDHESENWSKLIRFRDSDGNFREWIMPRSMLAGGGRPIREILLGKGYQAPYIGPNARDPMLDFLSTTVPGRFRLVNVTGWHGQVFVLPDESFGTGNEIYRFPPSEEIEHAFYTAGTLSDWQGTIGSWSKDNSRLAFAVSIAFAAPLLGILGEPGGGFHFLAKTSQGKTTSLMVAGSVWGGGGPEGAKGYLQQWRVTDNGLEGIAAAHTDALLCLDEIGAIDGKVLGEAAYMLANGQGKGRASRTGGVRKRAKWRVLYLSSGEVDLRTHVEAAGKKAKAGQEIRLAQVPYPVEDNGATWETLHGHDGPAAFADALQDAARRFYGTPIRAFLSKLVRQNPEAIREALENIRSSFVAENVPPNSASEVIRVAHRFALVATAGLMATEAQIVPWSADEAYRAASACFKAWLGARADQGATEDDQAVAQVRRFLELHGQSRFDDLDAREQSNRYEYAAAAGGESRIVNRTGFKRRTADESFEYLILPEVFREEVCKGFNHRATAKALAERGHLIRSGESDGRLARQERIPGMGKVRVYVVSSSIFGEGGEC